MRAARTVDADVRAAVEEALVGAVERIVLQHALVAHVTPKRSAPPPRTVAGDTPLVLQPGHSSVNHESQTIAVSTSLCSRG